MGNLGTLGIFFAGFFGGLGVFLAACGLLWWCSLYQKINLPKHAKTRKESIISILKILGHPFYFVAWYGRLNWPNSLFKI